MKKINVFLLGLLVAFTGFITSCEPETDTPFNEPTVEVKNGTTTVNPNDTVKENEGTPLAFSVKFTMGDAGDKLVKVNITSEIGGKVFNVLDSTLNEGLFNGADKTLTLTYNTSVGNTKEKVTFATTDKAGRIGKAVIYIGPKTVTPAGSIKTSTAIIMGSYNNATYGSCYSLSLNKVLTTSAAFSQQSAVDLFYFYGTTNLATLAAPTYSSLSQIFTNATNGIAKWTVKNDTKIYLYLTTPNFDGITTTSTFDATLPNFGTAAGVSNYWNQLEVGDVIAIKSANTNGTTAIMKVTELTTGASGYIKLTIKTKS